MTPYPDGEGPVFRCTRVGESGPCTWTGYPVESERCPAHPTRGPHQFEPLNFDTFSFQPLFNYAAGCGLWLQPSKFMAMGCRARNIEGVPVVIFAYKHCDSRNYLHLDDRGLSAWTVGAAPEPVPTYKAVQHATGMDHRHGDGCLAGSRIVTSRQRKAG